MVASFRPLVHASAWQMASWLVLLAFSLRQWQVAASGVFWGGLLVAANFWAMRLAAHLWYRHRGLSPSVAALLAGKLLASLAALAAAMVWGQASPVGLAAGLATFFVGALGASLQRPALPSQRRR